METTAPTAGIGSSALIRGRTAAEDFCRQLAAQDPVVAQKLLCTELERLLPNRAPELSQLGAVLTLDRNALPIGRRLTVRYVEGDAAMRVLDRRALSAALRLCHAFVEAYAHLWRHIEQAGGDTWRVHAATVLVQLFRHRQQEFLLRLFRYKKRNSEQWRQLNDGYRHALAWGVTRERPGDAVHSEPSGAGRTLEREFIAILLLDALNTGQFSPRDLLRANALIGRWSDRLDLRPLDVEAADRTPLPGFVVDLDGTEGLKRPSRGTAGALLHLDTAPLMQALDAELAGLSRDEDVHAAKAGHAADDSLLARLRLSWAPTPAHIRRRGERVAVDQPVMVVTGISSIVHLLRLEALRKAEQRHAPEPADDDLTIATDAALERVTDLARPTVAGVGPATTFGAIPQSWQVKDRSDTGCRMRGRADDLNALIPGSLVALAPHDKAPWTVAVVRRLRRLMVDHVEISVEYIGRRPRFVKIAMQASAVPGLTVDQGATCFGALYLPASDEHPRMPIKTLLVPARAFAAGANVTLLSSSATYALELGKPLQQHADFVWTSFTVSDKGAVPDAPMAHIRALG